MPDPRATVLVSLLALIALAPGAQGPATSPQVRAALSARTPRGVRPRQVRLALTVSPGWHIGAEQSGTAGLPTRLAWRVPTGWRVSGVRWPTPRREIQGRDTLYTYAGQVDIDALLEAPAAAAPGPVRADVSYGLCRDVCIPGRVSATLTP